MAEQRKGKEQKKKIQDIDKNLPPKTKSMVEQARDKGASSWLIALPLQEMDFVLNKQEFRDALRL